MNAKAYERKVNAKAYECLECFYKLSARRPSEPSEVARRVGRLRVGRERNWDKLRWGEGRTEFRKLKEFVRIGVAWRSVYSIFIFEVEHIGIFILQNHRITSLVLESLLQIKTAVRAFFCW